MLFYGYFIALNLLVWYFKMLYKDLVTNEKSCPSKIHKKCPQLLPFLFKIPPYRYPTLVINHKPIKFIKKNLKTNNSLPLLCLRWKKEYDCYWLLTFKKLYIYVKSHHHHQQNLNILKSVELK